MNDKKIIYTVTWQQDYEQWEKEIEAIDKLMDMIIDATEYADAKEVIERIKNL